ncbi:P-loop containing nucleoside triphosphate hydrolase protein [Mycena filopes]|nr:P-loop containing nucleoside triphosphate hydrolase protein [Mycena filopes]
MSSPPSFKSLGLIDPLLEALEQVNFTTPTEIQVEALPHALEGRDIIGVASTGSGKTAAFALPILQKLWEDPKACLQTIAQSVALAKRPHIVVATPGRLLWHLENTKGFSLKGIKFLVLDEADRLLDMDFGPVIDRILKLVPTERTTYLFSATMTSKVAKLQRASLSNPVKVEVSTKYQTVSTLLQYYLFMPICIILRTLGLPAVPLHGQLSQSQRLGALGKFKSGSRKVLVATDIASRGLDIPSVDVVINFDIPTHSKDYIHRVGRTARAGRAGKSITLVTQYDVELVQRIEQTVGKQMELWATDPEEIALLKERVNEAGRVAAVELKEQNANAKGGGNGRKHRREEGGGREDERDRDDDVVEAGIPARRKKFKSR